MPDDPGGETEDRAERLALAAAAEALAGADFGGALAGVAVGTTLAGREDGARPRVRFATPRGVGSGGARGSPRAPPCRARAGRDGLDRVRVRHGRDRPRGRMDPRRARDARPRGRRRRALGVRVFRLRRPARAEPDGRPAVRRLARRPDARRRGGVSPPRGGGGGPSARRARSRARRGLRLVGRRVPHDAARSGRRRPRPGSGVRSPGCRARRRRRGLRERPRDRDRLQRRDGGGRPGACPRAESRIGAGARPEGRRRPYARGRGRARGRPVRPRPRRGGRPADGRAPRRAGGLACLHRLGHALPSASAEVRLALSTSAAFSGTGAALVLERV